MHSALFMLAVISCSIWMFLALGHGRFWYVDREPVPPPPEEWPSVVAVIPARNEADGIALTLQSLWSQDYLGDLDIIVVDDGSDDGTDQVARNEACLAGRGERLRVLTAGPPPDGWTGKLWAMQTGLQTVWTEAETASYVLFSDADILHGRSALRELVCRAVAEGRDLVSFMVWLHCETMPERLLIPAFVFFFRMLYPFRRINDRSDRLAGAAGGTMLVSADALRRIGGLNKIRGELIDDCALGRSVKDGGHAIWVGLTEVSHSSRRYGRIGEVLQMIARTAYTQLGYSPLRLIGCVLGLVITFILPFTLVFCTTGPTQIVAGLAWLIMSLLYLPMVRFYRQSPLWAFGLPIVAVFYLCATLLSAWNHHTGKGGQWKGRSQSPAKP